MRKIITVAAVAAVAAVAIGLLGGTAGAQTAIRFSALTRSGSGHRAGNHFVVHGRLVRPLNHQDVIGKFRARFTRHGHIGAVFFFPNGKIKAAGDQDHARIPIVGGTGAWNGAAGKINIRNRRHDEALLRFTVVL